MRTNTSKSKTYIQKTLTSQGQLCPIQTCEHTHQNGESLWRSRQRTRVLFLNQTGEGSIPAVDSMFMRLNMLYVVGLPHKQLRAETYYYVMIDRPNAMSSNFK